MQSYVRRAPAETSMFVGLSARKLSRTANMYRSASFKYEWNKKRPSERQNRVWNPSCFVMMLLLETCFLCACACARDIFVFRPTLILIPLSAYHIFVRKTVRLQVHGTEFKFNWRIHWRKPTDIKPTMAYLFGEGLRKKCYSPLFCEVNLSFWWVALELKLLTNAHNEITE